MRKSILFIVVLILMPMVFNAQSIEWAVKPTYDNIQQLPYDLFKVEQNGKIGLITADGNVVLPVEYEKITDFKDGIALVTDKLCKQLVAIVYGSQKTYETISGYSVDSDFPYYSDGKLAVIKNGKWGFIDENGKECNGYLSCSNESVLPFSENVTFIKRDNKIFGYFDSNGNPLTGNFNTKMVEGYSFHNGQALVFNSNLSYAIVDKSGNVLRLIQAPKQKFMPQKNGKTITHAGNTYNFNNQWCMTSSIINGNTENYGNSYSLDKIGEINRGALSVDKQYLCDIKFNNESIVPLQFENAMVLNREYIAVFQNGKWGLVHVFPNQKISSSIPTTKYDFYHNTTAMVDVIINLPAHMKDKSVDIELKDENDNRVDYTKVSNDIKIAFEISPDDEAFDESVEKQYTMAVDCDGIHYLDKSFKLTIRKKQGFSISLSNKKVNADSTGYAEIKVNVRNTAKTKSDRTNVFVTIDDDNESISKVFAAGETVSIKMKTPAFMSDDFIEKNVNVRVSENGFPAITTKQKITITRYIPEEDY